MKLRSSLVRYGLFPASALLAALPALASEMATATVYGTPAAGGVYNYNISLTDTGTTPIGTLWFSWVPGAGFLSAVPSGISSPAGWTDLMTNAGDGIQWTSTTNDLTPGSSLSGFDFTSTETPTQLAALMTAGSFTEPGSVFYIYQGAPRATGDPGFTSVAAVTTTPEPPGVLLLGTGLLGAAGLLRRRPV